MKVLSLFLCKDKMPHSLEALIILKLLPVVLDKSDDYLNLIEDLQEIINKSKWNKKEFIIDNYLSRPLDHYRPNNINIKNLEELKSKINHEIVIYYRNYGELRYENGTLADCSFSNYLFYIIIGRSHKRSFILDIRDLSYFEIIDYDKKIKRIKSSFYIIDNK